MIFFGCFGESFAEVIRGGKELFITLATNTNSLLEVAYGHACVTYAVAPWMGEGGEQRDQTTVTPADYPDPLGIDFAMMVEHPLTRSMHILDFESAIINKLPKVGAVTAAAPIIRRNHRVTLLQQFLNNTQVFV